MAANRGRKQPRQKHPRANPWKIAVHCYKVLVWVVATKKDVGDMYGKITEISMLCLLNSNACAIVACQNRCQNWCRNTGFGWHGKRLVANLRLDNIPFHCSHNVVNISSQPRIAKWQVLLWCEISPNRCFLFSQPRNKNFAMVSTSMLQQNGIQVPNLRL